MAGMLIIGIGDPLRGDDGVGPVVAQELCRRLNGVADLDQFSGSSLDLLGRLTGRTRVVLIDAVEGPLLAPGECGRIDLDPVTDDESPFLSSHQSGLSDIAKIAAVLRVTLPEFLRIYGVGIDGAESYREGLSEALSRRISLITEEIYEDLLSESPAGGRSL